MPKRKDQRRIVRRATCQQCGYEWNGKEGKFPPYCPKCRSKRVDTKPVTY